MGAPKETKNWAGYLFACWGQVRPLTDENGNPREYFPHTRYPNPRGLRLHPLGAGPFCALTEIPDLPTDGGVYTVAIDDRAVYVGKTGNLSERFGCRGYAVIHPRNCYIPRGQAANVNVNHHLLAAFKAGAVPVLWCMKVRDATDRSRIEAQLIEVLNPPWNKQRPLGI